MGDGRGIGIVATGDDRDVEAFSPDLKLFDGRGAKGVARRQDRGVPLLENPVGKFGGGGGFARTVDADDGNDGQTPGLRVENRVAQGKTLGDFGGGHLDEVEPGAALGLKVLLHRTHDLLGHWQPEIGTEQGRLQFLEALRGEAGGTGDDAANLMSQSRGGLGEGRLQFIEKTHGKTIG